MLPKNRLCQKGDRAGGHARTPKHPFTLQKKFRQQLPLESATSADDPVTSTLAGNRRGDGKLRFFRQGSGGAGSGEGIAGGMDSARREPRPPEGEDDPRLSTLFHQLSIRRQANRDDRI